MKSLMDWTDWTTDEKIAYQTHKYFMNKFYNFKSNEYEISKIDDEIKKAHDAEYKRSLNKFKKFAIESNNED